MKNKTKEQEDAEENIEISGIKMDCKEYISQVSLL